MESLSPDCATILKYFYNSTTGDNWVVMADASDALQMPLEQILPRVQELVDKGYLDYRTGSRQPSHRWNGAPSVVVTATGRTMAKRLRSPN